MKHSFSARIGVGLFSLLWLAGCGGASPEAKNEASSAASAPKSGGPGTLSSASPEARPIEGDTAAAPEEGSPEWLVQEIARLRVQPLVPQETPADGEPIQTVAASVDVERLRTAARERNLKIVSLAEEAIAQTHHDPAREEVFNAAVHQLTEARLQLALGGEQAHIDALYESADLLKNRDAKSAAAVEAGLSLVKYAETNARKFAEQEPKWLEHFARQARIFANDFPQEQDWAVAILDTAAWSCEVHGLTHEAVACYTQIQEQYPTHPEAQHVAGVLRRLNLVGQPLQLVGETFDGGLLSIGDLQGQVVLVIFWAANQVDFEQHLPALKQAAAKYQDRGLVVVGVNVDEDEQSVQSFLAAHSITWPTIFFVDPAKRGWNNPLVQYYGVRNVPTYWIAADDGKVVATDVDPAQLDAVLPGLLGPNGQ